MISGCPFLGLLMPVKILQWLAVYQPFRSEKRINKTSVDKRLHLKIEYAAFYKRHLTQWSIGNNVFPQVSAVSFPLSTRQTVLWWHKIKELVTREVLSCKIWILAHCGHTSSSHYGETCWCCLWHTQQPRQFCQSDSISQSLHALFHSNLRIGSFKDIGGRGARSFRIRKTILHTLSLTAAEIPIRVSATLYVSGRLWYPREGMNGTIRLGLVIRTVDIWGVRNNSLEHPEHFILFIRMLWPGTL